MTDPRDHQRFQSGYPWMTKPKMRQPIMNSSIHNRMWPPNGA